MVQDIIGIIGGIGPYAGLDLLKKIFDNTISKHDNDHLPIVLYSIPQIIPDRTNYILNKSSKNPLEGLKSGVKELNKTGAKYIAIACNAAHSTIIFNPLKEWVKNTFPAIKLVSIIEETVQYIKNLKNISSVGVLSVYGTLKSRAYHNALEKNNIHVIEIPDYLQNKVQESIWNPNYGIKAFSDPIEQKAIDELLAVILYLKENGAQAVILGCTEIPLALNQKNIDDLLIIDASEILARALIKNVAPQKLIDLKALP